MHLLCKLSPLQPFVLALILLQFRPGNKIFKALALSQRSYVRQSTNNVSRAQYTSDARAFAAETTYLISPVLKKIVYAF